MDTNIWQRFICFIKTSITAKFKAFFPGMCFGLIGSQHILWIGLPVSVVTFFWKFLGTIVTTGASALTTSYIGYRFDKWKEKKGLSVPEPRVNRKKKNRA